MEGGEPCKYENSQYEVSFISYCLKFYLYKSRNYPSSIYKGV